MDIVKILSVVDTRQYEEVADDVWKPIPGSGDIAQCARCDRDHEVHATVLLASGESAIVGTGCMARDSMNVERKRIMRLERAAKRAAKLTAQLAKEEAAWSAFQAAKLEVERLPLPPWTHRTESTEWGDREVFDMGDASVKAVQPWAELDNNDVEGRVECLTEVWRIKRRVERGHPGRAPRHPRDTHEALQKVEARLAAQ